MTRKKIVDIFESKGIKISPAGIWKRDEDSGKKVAIDAKRTDGLEWEKCPQDNIMRYRAELSNLLICDFDDLKSVIDSKLFDKDWTKKFNDTFRYYTTNTNKMHCVFSSDIDIPKTRKTGNSRFIDGLDIITNGVVFTGHFYSSEDTQFKIFDNDIIKLTEDEVEFFVGSGVDAVDDFSDDDFSGSFSSVGVAKRENWNLVLEGSRNDELFKSICSELAVGIEKKIIVENVKMWNEKLNSPLDVKELKDTFNSAVRLHNKNHSEDTKKAVKKNKEALDTYEILLESGLQVWFDIDINKYAIKCDDEFWFLDKNSFKQRVMGYTGTKVKEEFMLNLPTYKSAYNPTKDDFFEDGRHGVVNLFRPSELMAINETSEVIPLSIRRLLENLFSNDADSLGLFLNWLACIYQHRIKTGVAWAFVGLQGTGKGLFVELLEDIFKHHMRSNVTDTLLGGNFNGWLENTLLIQLNEISTDYKSRIAVKNKIKTWITDKFVEVEKKGIDSRNTVSFANFIINSNEQIPFDLDDDDRRFNIVNPTIKMNSYEWFGSEYIKELHRDCRKFAEFLNGYKCNLDIVNKAIMNDKKQRIIDIARGLDHEIGLRIVKRDLDWFDIDMNCSVYDDIKKEFGLGFVSNKSIEFLYNHIHGTDYKVSRIKKTLSRFVDIGEDKVMKISGTAIRGHKLLE